MLRHIAVWAAFRTPSDTAGRSLICWVIGFPPCVVRPTAIAGPNRPPRVRSDRFRHDPVANTSAPPTDIGLRRWGPTHPVRMPYGALLSFDTVPHLWLPPDLPSRENRRKTIMFTSDSDSVLRANALATLGVGFPLLGPQVWTSTSYLSTMPVAPP